MIKFKFHLEFTFCYLIIGILFILFLFNCQKKVENILYTPQIRHCMCEK